MRTTMDYECLAQMGSMLGSGAVIVIDDSVCMVDLLKVILHFYHHESCGQCTPCREGTGWLEKVLHGLEEGHASTSDVDLLLNIAGNMMGNTICALADAAAMPVRAFVTKFRAEFEEHARLGRCPFKPATSELRTHAHA